VRSADLAVYADMLAGQAASQAAFAERLRSALRQAAIERSARDALDADVVGRLQRLGLLRAVDEDRLRAELLRLENALHALAELQAWAERELAEATAA
jgi:hypothetical protein